jgi:4-alpha-glucanotransferase
VQYRRQATLRRSVVEPLAERFFASGGPTSEAYRTFVRENPMAPSYARFRAMVERNGAKFEEWPEKARGGRLEPGDVDAAAERYHLYAQFAFQRQFGAITERMREGGGIVYLDLPVGVRGNGFDVWKNPGLFASAAMVGAPPDPYFTSGQKWGFPPMRPDVMEETGFAYMIDSVRHFMRWSDVLRLDHVMAFHRLFWIPRGMEAKDGVYVGYPEEPLWAILCLESHRNQCRLVGENLGTVPPAVERATKRHGIGSLYVAQYEAQPKVTAALRSVPKTVVASVNTHDMPPIATWLDGGDVDDRIGLGIFAKELREKDHAGREKVRSALESFLRKKGYLHTTGAGATRHAIHTYLAASDAETVLVNIEDLWLERHWQNVPGTSDVYPNWRHRLKHSLEQLEDDRDIARQLDDIERARAKRRGEKKAKRSTQRAQRARK